MSDLIRVSRLTREYQMGAETVYALGGANPTTRVQPGYGGPGVRGDDENAAKMDEFFKTVYAYVSDTAGTDMSAIFDDMDYYEFTPDDEKALYNYISDRVAQEKRYGVPDGTSTASGEPRRTPNEILEFTGLGG